MSGTTPVAREVKQYIGGEWVGARDARTFEDLNPFTGDVYARVPAGDRSDAVRAVAAASSALREWADSPPNFKQRLLLETARVVEDRRPELLEMLAEETGCGAAFAGFQLRWVVGALRQASGWVYQPRGEVIPSDMLGAFHMGIRRPLGVVAGFTPWNGAQVLAWRTILPPIVWGNTIVVKPSELAPVSAGLKVVEIMDEVGFPPGVVNVVTHAPGEAGPIADEFFENAAVRCINFTGSTRTGRLLAERAGRHLKRIVLELGGYNPLIILRDADLAYASDATAFSAFFHQGQICMNARKVLVDAPVYEEFVSRLVAKTESIPVGDPRSVEGGLGPLITERAILDVEAAVDDALAKGATLLTGGKRDGRCFQPTLLADVPGDALIASEEVFGPVLVVERVRDAQAAVAAANDTVYGLSAGVITSDPDQGLALAMQIEAGMVRVNDQTIHDEPQMPLGGVKDSGWGRAGPHSIEDFTQVQWISIQSGTRHFPL